VVHEVENILELFQVDALQIEERILVTVERQDAPEKRRTCSLMERKPIYVLFRYFDRQDLQPLIFYAKRKA
jgi:hypothetical protein